MKKLVADEILAFTTGFCGKESGYLAAVMWCGDIQIWVILCQVNQKWKPDHLRIFPGYTPTGQRSDTGWKETQALFSCA